MAQVKVRYWKDIPVSVNVRGHEDDRANVQLPKIYMVTVDAVATREGLTGSKEYVAEFRNEDFERDGDASEIAETVAGELQDQYPSSWLREKRLQAGIDSTTEEQIEQEARE